MQYSTLKLITWGKLPESFLSDTAGVLRVWGRRGRNVFRLTEELVVWVPANILAPLCKRPFPPLRYILPCLVGIKSSSAKRTTPGKTLLVLSKDQNKMPLLDLNWIHTVNVFRFSVLTELSKWQNTRTHTRRGPVSIWHWAAVARLRPSPGGGQDRDCEGTRTTARKDWAGEEEDSAADPVSGSQGPFLCHCCIITDFLKCNSMKF